MGLTYFFREMAAPETRATTARAAATPTTSLAPVPGLVVEPGVVVVPTVPVVVKVSVVTRTVGSEGNVEGQNAIVVSSSNRQNLAVNTLCIYLVNSVSINAQSNLTLCGHIVEVSEESLGSYIAGIAPYPWQDQK